MLILLLQVYIPDDDIIQTTAIINSIFDIQARYSLDLCQPSLCSPTESYTWTVGLWKELPTVLRYTTFIEVMVTQFSMDFFLSDVVDTLRYAESGGVQASATIQCLGWGTTVAERGKMQGAFIPLAAAEPQCSAQRKGVLVCQ